MAACAVPIAAVVAIVVMEWPQWTADSSGASRRMSELSGWQPVRWAVSVAWALLLVSYGAMVRRHRAGLRVVRGLKLRYLAALFLSALFAAWLVRWPVLVAQVVMLAVVALVRVVPPAERTEGIEGGSFG